MGKKKVKPNAFSVFMREFLDKEKRFGRRYPKEEWAAVTKPHYDKLSAAEKERYKQLAKTQPARVVVQPAKYTSQGVPLEVVEREQREKEEKERYMVRKIKNIVENAFLDNDIAQKPFVFIMANYFYKNHSSDYSPAEIAVIKWTFENGIEKMYHTFVDPGIVTMGFAFEAKDRSEKVHRLPPPPGAMGEKNYEKIYASILNVLGTEQRDIGKDDPKRPYVFIRKQDTEMIESILDQLSYQWKQTFDVFELEQLFFELKNKVNVGGEPIRITITSQFIEQDRYDATPNISCDFHENEDVTRHCSLSYVRRWFYLFADHICQNIGVTLVPGIHLPSNAMVAPPAPFEDDFGHGTNEKREDDYHSFVSSSCTGYSKFESDDSSSDY